MAYAAASVDPGFWAVIRFRSMTTWETQAASPSSKIAPRFFSAVSTYQGRPIFPGLLWSSSSSVNAGVDRAAGVRLAGLPYLVPDLTDPLYGQPPHHLVVLREHLDEVSVASPGPVRYRLD